MEFLDEKLFERRLSTSSEYDTEEANDQRIVLVQLSCCQKATIFSSIKIVTSLRSRRVHEVEVSLILELLFNT